MKKFAYKIFDAHQLICCSFYGEVNNLSESFITLTSDPKYSSDYNHLYDFRFCSLVVNIDQVPGFVQFLKNKVKIDGKRIGVYITNKPNEVVLTTIFSGLINDFQLNPNIVSTVEKACSILLLNDKSVIDLELILNELNKELRQG